MLNKKILVVEDDRDIIEYYEGILRACFDERIDIYRAFDGSEAMLHLKTIKFDGIILDYRMPKKDGIKIVKDELEDTVNSETPIILISGYIKQPQVNLIKNFRKNLSVLSKPIGKKTFIENILKSMDLPLQAGSEEMIEMI